MDQTTGGLFTNLLAAGLLEGTVASQQKLRAVFREAEFSAEIDAIETEFHRTLRASIEERDAERETGELSGIVDQWDSVVERLETTREGEEVAENSRLVFTDEADAIDQLVREIAAVEGYDPEQTPQLHQALKWAVTKAYRSADRQTVYRLTQPCEMRDCPHNADLATCEAREHGKGAACTSSRSPHGIRRGSITDHLRNGTPQEVVSDRANVSKDVLEQHYVERPEREKMQIRRDFIEGA